MSSRRRLADSVLDASFAFAAGERVLVRTVRAVYTRPVFENANFLTFLPVACVAAALGPSPQLLGMSAMVLVGVLVLLADERARYLPGREPASAKQLEALMAPAWAGRFVAASPLIRVMLRLAGLIGIAGTVFLLLERYAQLPLLLTAVALAGMLPLSALLVIAAVALATPGPGSVETARRAASEGRWSVSTLYLFVGCAIAFALLFVGNMIFPAAAFALRGCAVIGFGAGTGLVLVAVSRCLRWAATHPPGWRIAGVAIGLAAVAVAMSVAGLAVAQRFEATHMTWTDAWRVLAFRPVAASWTSRGVLTVGMLAPLLPVAALGMAAANAAAVWLLRRVVRFHPSGISPAAARRRRAAGAAIAWIGIALIAGGVIANRVFSNLEQARLGLAASQGTDVGAVLDPLESRGLTVPRLLLLAQLSMWCGASLALLGWRLRAAGMADTPDAQAPVVLYLRAFAADAVKGRRHRAVLFGGMPFRTLEQDVVERVSAYGRVVALGRPADLLPPLGAQRIYVDDDRWQETVSAQMAKAALVLIRAGNTGNLRWELEQARRAVAPERLLLWFDDPDPDRRQEDAVTAVIESALSIGPLPPRPAGTRFVRFDTAWRPTWSAVPVETTGSANAAG